MSGEYDDAWWTPGWTAQWGYLPDAGTGNTTAPTPPAGLKAVPMTGHFVDEIGRPMWGMFEVTPSVRTVRSGGVTVTLRKFLVQLRNGQLLETNVLSPDGSQPVDPPVWTYHIRQRVGASSAEYDLSVPCDDTVDVYDLQTPSATDELPLHRDFVIPEGATFRKEYQWIQPGDSDLSDWTARMQIRTAIGGTILLELTQSSGITLGEDGSIEFEISAEQTSSLSGGVYDLELYEPGGDTVRFLEGAITIDPNVTE